MSKRQSSGEKVVARNRRARHEFDIEDTYEAGMVLQGTEVKSLREGNCSIEEAYARPRNGEVFLFDMHIAPYEQGGIYNHEPKRPRKLLLHGREIDAIRAQVEQQGYTMVPLRVYFKNGYAKVEIGLARRRKQWDERRKKEERQRRQDLERQMRRRSR